MTFNLSTNYSIRAPEFCLMFGSHYLHLFLLAAGDSLSEKSDASCLTQHDKNDFDHSYYYNPWTILKLLRQLLKFSLLLV